MCIFIFSSYFSEFFLLLFCFQLLFSNALRPHHHHHRRFPAIAILVAPSLCCCWSLGSCNKSWSRAAWVRARWPRAWKKDRDRFPVCTCVVFSSARSPLSLSRFASLQLQLSFAIYLAYFTVSPCCYCLLFVLV